MEFSSDILKGLGYLANGSHFSDENFKKIVNSSLGLLAGEHNIDRVATICPEKGDIVRKSYTALLTFTLEVLRFSADEDIKNILAKQNLKADRIGYYIKNFDLNKDSIVASLRNCTTSWPNLIDATWRLDFVVKTNVQNHMGEPVYFIILTTAKEGKIEHIKFTCDLHQLQDLCTRLKEIVSHIEKLAEMNNEWNRCIHNKNRAPPQCTVETVVKQSETMDIISTLSDVCSTYQNLKVLNVEAAFLARFIYRFKRIYRQDKGMQLLVKVNQALKRFRAYRSIGPIKRLGTCFPEKIPPDGSKAYLPTRQLLKWVLFRFLSNVKLFLRIIELCKHAATYINGRLRTGWNPSNMLIALAITSRILTCSKYMLIKTIEWYDSLYVRLPALTETAEFMRGFEFPKKMEDFIGYVDLRPPTKKADIDKIFELIDLTRGDDKEDNDDIILMNEIINAADSENDIEITKDDVIVEQEKIRKKGKKRGINDDVAVLYEQTKRPAPSLVPLKIAEDLGEPVQKKKNLERKEKRKRNISNSVKT